MGARNNGSAPESRRSRLPPIQCECGRSAAPMLRWRCDCPGMLGLSWDDLTEVRRLIRPTSNLTAAPFGMNLKLDEDQHDRLEAGRAIRGAATV